MGKKELYPIYPFCPSWCCLPLFVACLFLASETDWGRFILSCSICPAQSVRIGWWV